MNILLVKTSAIGDVLQTFGVVEYLRARYPSARIDWVVERSIAPLVKAHPFIDHVIAIDTKRWRRRLLSRCTYQQLHAALSELRSCTYDIVFDLQGNMKSGLVTAWARADVKVGFARDEVQERFNLLCTTHQIRIAGAMDVRTKYLSLVQSYLQDASAFMTRGISLTLDAQEKKELCALREQYFQGQSPVWMVCFGSHWKNKRLPQESWITLLEKHPEATLLFVYGNSEEKKIAERLHTHFISRSYVCPPMSLPLWQHVMQGCDLVLSVDSAALHLCATTKTPSVGFFGASSAQAYNPCGDHHRAIQGACPYGQQFKYRCPRLRSCPTGACMHDPAITRIYF